MDTDDNTNASAATSSPAGHGTALASLDERGARLVDAFAKADLLLGKGLVPTVSHHHWRASGTSRRDRIVVLPTDQHAGVGTYVVAVHAPDFAGRIVERASQIGLEIASKVDERLCLPLFIHRTR